ncbi:transmembrane protein 62-like [Glandiceps talaboti]
MRALLCRCIGLSVICAVVLSAWLLGLAVEYFTTPADDSESRHLRDDKPPYPGDDFDNIWWFVQISDLHLSRYYDPDRIHKFRHFCEDNVDIIHPSMVLVTGDITDSVFKMKNKQEPLEWKMYHDILMNSGVLDKTVWIDIKGNHDTTNVPSLRSKENYFRNHSNTGISGESHFVYKHKTDFGTYSFIHIESNQVPGPKSPLNSFGILTKSDIKQLEALTNTAMSANSTIFFGHYPSSFIVEPKPGISDVISHGIAYLSGHLHDLRGYVSQLCTVQKSGTLELEVVDWKANRAYRIAAFDHDLFSFVDVRHGQWPVILITNPKDARYMAPKHEPLGRVKHSTHIRFLVFSPHPVKKATVLIDRAALGIAMHIEGPLYAISWNPSSYSSGLHSISIVVEDADGRTKVAGHQFSLDGSRPPQLFLSSFVLMVDMALVLKVCFMIAVTVAVLPLYVVRKMTRPNSTSISGVNISSVPMLTGLVRLVHVDFLYYFLIVTGCYSFIGPWYIGEIIDGHIGFTCLYGVYVNGVFIPDPIIYKDAILDIVCFQIPMTLYLVFLFEVKASKSSNSSSVDLTTVTSPKQRQQSKTLPGKQETGEFSPIQLGFCYLILLIAIIWQLRESKRILYRLGIIALLLCPKVTWTLPFIFYIPYVYRPVLKRHKN